jgi:hypothetical protein
VTFCAHRILFTTAQEIKSLHIAPHDASLKNGFGISSACFLVAGAAESLKIFG